MNIWTVITPSDYPHSFATEKLAIKFCANQIIVMYQHHGVTPMKETLNSLYGHGELELVIKLHNSCNDAKVYHIFPSDLVGHLLE